MVCDRCGKGKMKPYGNIIITTFPEQYPHKCDSCGYEENYHIRYPYHKLVPIEPLRKESEGKDNDC